MCDLTSVIGNNLQIVRLYLFILYLFMYGVGFQLGLVEDVVSDFHKL